MIRKSLFNIYYLSKNNIGKQRRYSALFVSGAKASEHYIYVTPHVDVKEILKNKDVTQQLNKRKCSIDLVKIENLWSVYQELKTKKTEYEEKKAVVSKELGKLIKTDPQNDEITKLKIKSDLLKDNIKKLKEPLWSAEEATYIEALKIPNSLHPKTPDTDCVIPHTHLSPPKNDKNHLIIGQNKHIINYKNNESYYLTGDAAIFELGAKFYFSSIFKQNKFIQFSNPDFVKSLIVEGCGSDHTNPDATYILHHNDDTTVNKDNRLHLTGGASLYSFLAYHTKTVIYPKVLPLKYFTIGRQYIPTAPNNNGLLEVSQASVLEIFGVVKSMQDADILLDQLTEILKNAYISLGYHFRIVIVPAEKLKLWESMRVSIEMYSTSKQAYIEVGYVSLSNDYISKRLLFTYTESKEQKFPHLISGTILNVPKLLACVLEQDQDFVLPDLFKVEKWSM